MPYAIIKTGGKQFRVEPGRTYKIPSVEGEAGGKIEFNVRHGRGDKIVIFKQKRRKNYARKRGHRQGFTEVRINDISLG